MYLNVMLTAIAVQHDLTNAYLESGKSKASGAYLLAHERVTVAFFERTVPPAEMRELHGAFLRWLKSGAHALIEELKDHQHRPNDASQRHEEAARQLTSSLKALAGGPARNGG